MSQDDPDCETPQGGHPLLGARLHRFVGRPTVARAPRTLLVLGVLSAVMVPIGVKWVPGLSGTIVAVLAGLVAIACYMLSGGRMRAPGIDIRIFEMGIVCSQGSTMRELRWNEVVDITARRLELRNGKTSMAIALEVVCAEPLLIVVGAPFTDAEKTRELVEELSAVWLGIWCRRARTLLQANRPLTVGRASLTHEGASVGGRRFYWSAIEGVEASDHADLLRTTHGILEVEIPAGNVSFPSAARRLSALADNAPIRAAVPAG